MFREKRATCPAPLPCRRAPVADPKPKREITLEEWIAATQACCGIDLDDDVITSQGDEVRADDAVLRGPVGETNPDHDHQEQQGDRRQP